jgi:hypothetical protein
MVSKSYSKGISWIDDCRIPFVDGVEKPNAYHARKGGFQNVYVGGKTNNTQDENTTGRFPANLLVSDDMLNDGVISKSKSGGISSGVNFGGETTKYRNRIGHDDKGTNSRYYDIDKWFNNLIDV